MRRLKIGVPLLILMAVHYSKLLVVLGLGFFSDILQVYLGDMFGFNIGSVLLAVGIALVIHYIYTKKKKR